MLVPKDTQEFNVETNRTAVLALMALASIMACTAGLMILGDHDDRTMAGDLSWTRGAVPEGMADKMRLRIVPAHLLIR
jgi:hypothetical protein